MESHSQSGTGRRRNAPPAALLRAVVVSLLACWLIQAGCAKQQAASPPAKTPSPVELVKAGGSRRKPPRRRHGRCVVRIGGKTLAPETHAIVISATPTPQQQYAADDLYRHLQWLTGKRIPILNDDQADGRNAIVVGKCKTLDKLGVRIDWDSLGSDGIVIRTVGTNLVLAGNKRGVLYACYTFLEDYLGWRWLTPLCTVYPKEGNFDVPRIDRTYVPPLQYRCTRALSSRNADWNVRNKINAHPWGLVAAKGGTLRYARRFVHTFYSLVPPDKYFKDHPEYFAEVNGRRQSGRAQLCLSNPEVARIAAETAKRWLRAQPAVHVISISQVDYGNYCRCDKCKAIDRAEGGPSGSLLRFVNKVAEEIEKEFPDVLVSTLAYHYTRKPPKITRARRNVAIRLCSAECSFSQPLDSKQNESFLSDMRGWAKITGNLHIWDYVLNYKHYIQPYPNLRVLQPNIKLFVASGVKSVQEQGRPQRGGDLVGLRTWLLAKLLWNPDADVDELMGVYLEGYYGPAAPFIRKYIDLIHDAADRSGVYMAMNHDPINSPLLTPELLAEAAKLFDRAEQAVRKNPTFLDRVQTARLSPMYVRIVNGAFCYKETPDKLVQVGAGKDMQTLIDRFEAIARRSGVAVLGETGLLRYLDPWLKAMRRRTPGFAIERIGNGKLELTVTPQLGGRIWRMRYLPADRDNVLKPPDYIQHFGKGPPRAHYGGYAETIRIDGRSAAFSDEFKVFRREKRAVVLRADLGDGIRVTRRIELDRDKAIVRIVSTLTNTDSVAHSVRTRVFPSLGVAETRRASVRVKSAAGIWRPLRYKGTARLAVWLRDKQMPAGEWELVDETDTDTKNIRVINRFRPEQISECYIYWSAPQGRVYLQMYSPDRKLAPGESTTIELSYEVLRTAKPAGPDPTAETD